ncbi:MAG: multiheme c-type cytochrome, partial [Planctomycetota bacterium]
MGSARCQACHAAEFEAWKSSHHALAERELVAELDAPAFDDETPFTHGHQESSVGTEGERFVVRTRGEDGEIAAFPVERAFGVSPLRQYLVDFGSGRLQVTDLAYDPRHDDWFDVFGDEARGPHEWGSWTGRGMTWNSMCVDCHATNVAKNYHPESDSYATTTSELGVACEAC